MQLSGLKYAHTGLAAYVIASLLLLVVTVLIAPFRAFIDLSNVALLYVLAVVLAVVLAGTRYGRSGAIFAAVLGSLLFAYVFVPPHFSLAITDLQYLLSALIMLGVALLVGHLTANLRAHAEAVEAQAAQTKSLYEFAKQLSATRSSEAVIDAGLRFLAQTVDAQQARFIAPTDAHATLEEPVDAALVASALDCQQLVTRPLGTSDSATAVVPLCTLGERQGVIRFVAPTEQIASTSKRGFIETIGSLMAVALERTHYLEMARDIEVRHAAESLRNTILSSLSHDIRTPLTALVGTADTLMLTHNLPPERQQSLLRGLREQAQSIHQFVNNLLDMARLQSGKVEPNLAWQPIEEVVGAALQQIRNVAEDRAVDVRIAPDLPPLRIDATLMERALWNLLENAVKYSPPGTPIELNICQKGELLEIIVCDRGQGLPENGAEALFGLFQRGRPESNVPGAGIGLAIVKSIADLHHGQLSAETRVGGGSCFRLTLPIGQPPQINFEDEA